MRRCHVLCISDPCGHRIGSGGGTLNAINAVVSSFPKESLVGHKVAIIHSGGDSQRSPLHSVCGKAWATINTYPDSSVVRDSSDGYSTAFSLILTQLNLVARTLHPNSIMVSCSDVILNLGMISSDLGEDGSSVPVDCVCVVCLPEVLSVATNHGCLCVETEQTSGRGPEASRVYVKPVHQYYQKPSIDVLRRHCLYSCGATADEMTLIDSGITVFQGTAVEVSGSRAYNSLLESGTYSALPSLVFVRLIGRSSRAVRSRWWRRQGAVARASLPLHSATGAVLRYAACLSHRCCREAA